MRGDRGEWREGILGWRMGISEIMVNFAMGLCVSDYDACMLR